MNSVGSAGEYVLAPASAGDAFPVRVGFLQTSDVGQHKSGLGRVAWQWRS
ncbi:hypothetical protein RA2_03750 [Roseovarius sp. A-2]|nr:hypothetical protein RA2_03750 [Roseovarius sp. A-2]